MTRLPSFPHGDIKILELPPGAPDNIRGWIESAKFSAGILRWFSLIGPRINSVEDSANSTLMQLLGQSGNENIQDYISRLSSIVSDMQFDDQRASFSGGVADDPLRSLPLLNVVSAVIQDTRANRSIYPAAQFDGWRYFETDSNSTLVYRSTGGVWTYAGGTYSDVLASILTGLTTADAKLLFEVTDYDHVLQWTGSAWTWGPGELGSGYVQAFGRAPNSAGASAWQVCDGSTVAVLNADGTTTNVAVPNYSTAAYLKLISAAATIGPTAASGTVGNTTATNIANSTGITVDAHATDENAELGAGNFAFPEAADAAHVVNDPTHNHTQNAHNHAPGTLELRNTELLAYYRR